MDDAQPWDRFGPWVRQRLAEGVTTLYVDEPRRTEPTGVPPDFDATAGHLALWAEALGAQFPRARVESAKEAIHALRSRKSPREAEILEANAPTHRGGPQGRCGSRGAGDEAADCRVGGGERVYRGRGARTVVLALDHVRPECPAGQPVQAFFRYEQLDRQMEEGEVIRVDIGCAANGYGADVGRTLPVSGVFTDAQAETWDLLVAGYEAGTGSHGRRRAGERSSRGQRGGDS